MSLSRPPLVTVVGIGAEGWSGLSGPSRDLVTDAHVLLGGSRHLALVPPVGGQVRESWPSPLRDALAPLLARHRGRRVVALASGDPMRSGVGSTLVAVLGADLVRVEPAVSSVALARARMGWSAEETEVVSLVGRPLATLVRQLAPGRRVVVLSPDPRTSAEVAALLDSVGYGASRVTVLGDLGSSEESRVETTAAAYDVSAAPLAVLALHLDGPGSGSWAGGLPDDAYEHDGQLTKRDLRASALARLRPLPGQLLWDVGAGAGSVGIEWSRAHPTARTVAVERSAERAARVARNAAGLGVPMLEVVTGDAPDVLGGLPDPDAVFVGGGASVPGLLDTCCDRLRPGGRLVAHGVTLETESVLAGQHHRRGGELTRHAVETAAPIGGYTGWTPARSVTQWTWEKP